jgi:hypothetical protein
MEHVKCSAAMNVSLNKDRSSWYGSVRAVLANMSYLKRIYFERPLRRAKKRLTDVSGIYALFKFP